LEPFLALGVCIKIPEIICRCWKKGVKNPMGEDSAEFRWGRKKNEQERDGEKK
jgi:hypothetical protein